MLRSPMAAASTGPPRAGHRHRRTTSTPIYPSQLPPTSQRSPSSHGSQYSKLARPLSKRGAAPCASLYATRAHATPTPLLNVIISSRALNRATSFRPYPFRLRRIAMADREGFIVVHGVHQADMVPLVHWASSDRAQVYARAGLRFARALRLAYQLPQRRRPPLPLPHRARRRLCARPLVHMGFALV